VWFALQYRFRGALKTATLNVKNSSPERKRWGLQLSRKSEPLPDGRGCCFWTETEGVKNSSPERKRWVLRLSRISEPLPDKRGCCFCTKRNSGVGLRRCVGYCYKRAAAEWLRCYRYWSGMLLYRYGNGGWSDVCGVILGTIVVGCVMRSDCGRVGRLAVEWWRGRAKIW
jgi:hypothetical protein